MRNGEATARVLEALRDAIQHAKESAFENNGQSASRGDADAAYAVCLGMVDSSLMTIKALSAKPRGRPAGKSGASA